MTAMIDYKGKGLWSDRKHRAKPSVSVDGEGGLIYRYTAYRTAGKPRCRFTLFCEVGEPYQPAFAGFFKTRKLADKPVTYDRRPWLSDTLEKGEPGTEVFGTEVFGRHEDPLILEMLGKHGATSYRLSENGALVVRDSPRRLWFYYLIEGGELQLQGTTHLKPRTVK